MPRTIIIPPGTVFKTVSPPDAADMVVQGPIKLLTGARDDEAAKPAFPRGPFKQLTGGRPLTFVRPMSGGSQGHCSQLSGEVDQLLRIEHDPDLCTLKCDDDPGNALFGGISCLLNADAGWIDFGSAIGTLLSAQSDEPQAGLDCGKRGHRDPIIFAVFRLPDADSAADGCNLGYSVIWQSSEHLAFSLVAPLWSLSADEAAPDRGGAQ